MPRKRKVSKLYKYNCKKCDKYCEKVAVPRAEPVYCSHYCYSEDKRLPFRIKNGYKLIYKPDNYRADKRGYVREHIYIMEKKIGRPIERSESIHHIDGNKLNNQPDNLQLFENHTEHLKHHWKENSLR